MKTFRTISVALVTTVMCMNLVSCSNSDEEEFTGNISEEEIEWVLGNVERLDSIVSPIFLEAECAEEMAEQLKKIRSRAMEGVERMWIENGSFCVKMKKGGIVSWWFTPEEEETDGKALEEYLNSIAATRSANDSKVEVCENKSFCIINQQSNDLSREIFKNLFENFISNINDLSEVSSVDLIESEDFTLKFINTILPSYGSIFLVTHGSMINNRHFILTGEEWDRKKFLIS